MGKVKIEVIPLEQIEPNKGQVEGLPKNPRFIRDDSFEKLKKSIQSSPEMMSLRELIVYPIVKGARGVQKYIVIGGNQRYRALQDLGEENAICKVLPKETTIEQLKAYTIKDNGSFGRWDFDILANQFDDVLLDDWGVDVSGFNVKEQDFEDAGSELNVDDFDDRMKLEIKLLPEQAQWVRAELAKLNSSPEIALLMATGYNEDEQENDDAYGDY